MFHGNVEGGGKRKKTRTKKITKRRNVRRRLEKEEMLEKERKREEENRRLFETIIQQNQGIKDTVEARFQDIEKVQKDMETRLKTTEIITEETTKIVQVNREKCKNRSRMMWEEMNRIQEGTQQDKQEWERQVERMNKKIEENEKQMKECDERRTERIMSTQDKEDIEKLKEELKKKMENLKRQHANINQNSVINYLPNNQIVKFDGKTNKIHPVVFFKMLKNKVRHLVDFEDVREILREGLERDGLIWFSGK